MDNESLREAQAWVQSNYSLIEKALWEELEEIYAASEELMFLPEDIFSNAVCYGIRRVDENLWLPGMIRERYVVLSQGWSDFRDINDHCAWSYNGIKIDPTIGQACDLDIVIPKTPHLFQGRILVAYDQEIKEILRVRYINKSRISVL